MKKEILSQFDGYDAVVTEAEVTRKYGIDYTRLKGDIEKSINLLHPPKIGLRVSEIIPRTEDAKTIRLVPVDGYLPPFQAGQYISVGAKVGNIETSRPYSISSPPSHRGYYDITVKQVENGLVSTWLLSELKSGDLLESSGPAGNFYHNPLYQDKNLVCIAGGCGITPFMSLIAETLERGLDRSIHLFYGNRTMDNILFHDILEDLVDRFDNFHYHPVIEESPASYRGATGLITGELIKETLGAVDDKTFYLCGPQGMYDFCLPELRKLNIPEKKIRKELSGPPTDVCSYDGWPEGIGADTEFNVRINGGETIRAKAGESLMTAIEKNGRVVKSLCRSGECSYCRTRILSGEVFETSPEHVRESDRWFDYVHACVSFPISDLEILI